MLPGMMQTGFFGSAAAVDYSIAVIPIATGTSGATVNYTSSEITGLTPAGALVIGSVHAIANDPSETADASFSIGSIVGSTCNVVTTRSRDGQAATTTTRDSSSSSPIFVYVGSGVAVQSTAGSTVSGGISITYSITATNRRAMAAAFTGAGTSAKNGIVALGTGTTAITVSGVGFQPDVVILYGHGDDFAAGQTALHQYTFGFCTGDGTQMCVVGAETNGVADGAPFQALLTDCAGGNENSNGTGRKLTVGGFGADGFTITPSANSGSDDVAYLALKFTGQSVKIISFDTPTATGSQAITGVGFKPQFAIAVLTNLETVNSHSGATSDLQSGFAVSFIGNESWAMSSRIDSGAATTDTATLGSNLAILGASSTASDAIKATLTSFDADGLTLNYSAVQANAKKGFMLCIQ